MAVLSTSIQKFLNVIWLLVSSITALLLCPFRIFGVDPNWVFSRVYSRGIMAITRTSIEVENREGMDKFRPCVFVANHQHNLDLAYIGSVCPHDTYVIGKKELLWVPIFGQLFIAAGNIAINRQKSKKALSGIDTAAEAIRRRVISIFIFPEGTRNKTSEVLLPFKKGAFHMAIHAGVPIVPYVCSPYRDIAYQKKRLKIRVLPPIDTKGMTVADVDRLLEMTRNQMMEAVRGLATHRP